MRQWPGPAVAGLWDSRQLGLLHPRFGFADAFNLEAADAWLPDFNPPASPVLRTAGPWVDFTGFAIDHGPMLAAIDNYLRQEFVTGLLTSYPTIANALDRGPDGLFSALRRYAQNPADPLDVTADGMVTALDPLIVINDVNAQGVRRLSFAENRGSDVHFLDASGDGEATAIDVLLIVNAINARAAHGAVAEGESPSVPAENSASERSPWQNPSGPVTDVNNDKFTTPLDALVTINFINHGGVGDVYPEPSAEQLAALRGRHRRWDLFAAGCAGGHQLLERRQDGQGDVGLR